MTTAQILGIQLYHFRQACLETNQSVAIAIISLPSCPPRQQPRLFISDQEDCKTPSFSPAISSESPGQCLFFTSGRGIGSAGFVCRGDTTATSSSSNTTTSQTATSSIIAPTAQPTLGRGSSGSSGLSVSDKINLACAIGFGGPGLILAYLTLKNRSAIIAHGDVRGPGTNEPLPPYSP
jgi:hypothetical protein